MDKSQYIAEITKLLEKCNVESVHYFVLSFLRKMVKEG